jgi:hypothetical protein
MRARPARLTRHRGTGADHATWWATDCSPSIAVGGILDEGVRLDGDVPVERVDRAAQRALRPHAELTLDLVEVAAALLGGASLRRPIHGEAGLDRGEHA